MSDDIYTRTCPICSAKYSKDVNVSRRMWSERYKACSKACAAKLRGAPWLEAFKLNPGAQLGKATQFKKRQKPHNFKGDDASYTAKHMWAKYHLGKANYCEMCGTDEKRMYHWSNISGNYQRDKDDWQQLCVPCHKRFDLAKV